MSQDYGVIAVGYFQLDNCHGYLWTREEYLDKITMTDFPPDNMMVDGMGFDDLLAHDELVLDQTELLAMGPDSTFIIGPAGNIAAFDVFEDFVYVDNQRTFYAAVTDSLGDASQVGNPAQASPYTVERVKQAYYLPAMAGPTISSPARLRTPSLMTVTPNAPSPSGNAGTTINGPRAPVTSQVVTEDRVLTKLRPGVFGTSGKRVAKFSDTRTSLVGKLGSGALAGLAGLDQTIQPASRNGLVDYLHWNFRELYHPFICQLIGAIYKDGPQGLYTRRVEVDQFFDYFLAQYGPNPSQITPPYPVEDYDFTQTGGYALYNWEVFFHIPLLLASRLTTNQQFEEAQKWFHYIFNPMDASSDAIPKKFWVTKPFFEHGDLDYLNAEISRLLQLINQIQNNPDPELTKQITQWEANPFNPHLIARLRTVAYQKTTVMKYLDNLIAWGDQLFKRDTIETINEATQLYILAAEILGPRPEAIAPRATIAPETYDSLAPQLDGFSNALIMVENLVPPVQGGYAQTDVPTLPLPYTLYFTVPNNTKLLSYWDTVADRLFKIRHSLNIEGVFQQLPLFEPPIDPALLVAATAAGVDIASALSDLNAPAPLYRFSVMLEKANVFCAEVKGMGVALLAALEKSDAEGMASLRSSNEIALLNAVKSIKTQQVQEALDTIDGLNKSKAVIQLRHDYYAGLQFTIDGEKSHLDALSTVSTLESVQCDIAIVSAILSLFPELKIGFPSTCGATLGGANLAGAAGYAKEAIAHSAADTNVSGQSAVTMASYTRRYAEYQFQASLAAAELTQIQSQIETATLRWRIATAEVANQDLQITNAQGADDLMHSKFTNQELYDWMINQISSVYFQAYQLAFDIAKRAEACYRFELGITDANKFITFGYWDSLRQGLLAGERLSYDLKQLELAYLENNKREYEITKYISLASLAPRQLVNLRETGTCLIDIPEWIFDLDYPGHYLRRIKNVSITIPCVPGPYTSINATLTLGANSTRLRTTPTPTYGRSGMNDTRFKDNFTSARAIVTSAGQNDSGLFELNFRDERYLPFEGAGAISTWTLEMPPTCNAFDFETITDIILKLQYTAREGGNDFSQTVQKAVALPPPANLALLTSANHDSPNDWHRFQHPSDVNATTFVFVTTIGPERFPFLYRNRITSVNKVALIVRPADPNSSFVGDTFNLTAPDGSTAKLTLGPGDPSGSADPSGTAYALPFDYATLGSVKPFGQWTFSTAVDPTTIADMFFVFCYSVT
ncbi:hypothetical protein OKW43_008661 [Paraburkholderia sp. WC7.3g]|uniref:Tc toxin subunit A-related protein n=1 Tax=Paraburkholderia sp. WC7.3g TaxID=2991070 RepID=UPI003D204338